MASPTEGPSPLSPSTNVRVGFFVDQYNVIYSKCKEVFLGVKTPTESLALSSNQVLFISADQIIANGKAVVLSPAPLSAISVFDKDAHYDFWGVIPININPMSKKKTPLPVASAEDLMIQNTATHQVAGASYYIEAVDRRNKNLHNKPQELIRKLPVAIPYSLPPKAVSIVKAVAKVEIVPKEKEELIKKERLSMSQTLDNFIDSAAEATAALAKLVSDAKALAKDPPTVSSSNTIIEGVPTEAIAYELSPSDIRASYLIATAQRKSMVEGLQILAKALRGYQPKVQKGMTINPNSSYNPSLGFIAGELDGLAEALQVVPAEAAPKTYLKSLGGFLRNYSFSVSFLLMQMKSYPCFSQDTVVEKELSLNIHKISKAIQEDLTTLRNNANLLDV